MPLKRRGLGVGGLGHVPGRRLGQLGALDAAVGQEALEQLVFGLRREGEGLPDQLSQLDNLGALGAKDRREGIVLVLGPCQIEVAARGPQGEGQSKFPVREAPRLWARPVDEHSLEAAHFVVHSHGIHGCFAPFLLSLSFQSIGNFRA